MNTGEKIRQLRIDAGMTQEDLGKAAQTTKQNIYKYEAGIITNIPAVKIGLIAKALNTTPAYLMGWDEEKTEKAKASIDLSKVDPRLLKLLDEVMAMPESQREKFFNMMISSLSILLDQQEPEKK